MAFKLFRGHNAELVNHLFQTLLVTYLVLLLIEQLWKGLVSVYFNLNYLLIIVILLGVVDVFSEVPEKPKRRAKKIDYLFVVVLGILGFVIIKIKTADLKWLSWVISLIAGVLIILLSFLVLEDDKGLGEGLGENYGKQTH
jgi:cytochrome c biogenesis factor